MFRMSVAAGRASPEDELREAALRQAQFEYLRDSIKLLRRFYSGFEARDGYPLERRKLVRLPGAKLGRIRRLAGVLRRQMSRPHVVYRPRSKAAEKALYQHTGADRVRGRKAFVVHVERPQDTVIRIRKGTTRKRPAIVQEVRKVRGAEIAQEYFYFTDYYPRQPRTMREVLTATRRMLPDMPRGYYLFQSSAYGSIGVAIPRDRLEEEIEIDWLAYEKRPSRSTIDNRGLAETLVGFRRMATRVQVDREYNDRLMHSYNYARERARLKESRRARRRKLLKGK